MVVPQAPGHETATKNARVMLVSENELGALLLGEALARLSCCEVIKSLASSEEALLTAATTTPDVAVINQDLEAEPLKGLHLTALLASAFSGIRIIVMADPRSPEVIAEAFQSGARGIFHHGEPLDALRKCIHEVYRGQIYATQADLSYLLEKLVPLRLLNAQGRPMLTNKEQAIANSVTEGYTNREIAKKFQLSEHTIKNYLFRIFDKLGISSRAELILFVLTRRPQPCEEAADPTDAKSFSESMSLSLNLRRAYEGCASAQYRLGEFYDLGQGVPKDRGSAYMWFTIAEKTAAGLFASARTMRNRLLARMPSSDVATAESRVTNWLNNHGETRDDHEQEHLTGNDSGSKDALAVMPSDGNMPC